MAKKKQNEVAVGLTVLVALILTIFIVMTLADWSSMFVSQQEITIKLPYKTGLKGLIEGSPIYLGGVKIGSISETGILEPDPSALANNEIFVFFTMKLPEQYQLRSDCTLVPQSNVLGGQVLLSIDDLGQQGDIIKNGEVADLKLAGTVMDALKREFDPEDPESLLARIKYEFTRENKDSIVAYFKSAISQLDKDIPVITELIQKELGKIDEALESAKSTMEQIKSVAKDERIGKIINNVTETSSNLKLATQEIRRAPWKLLYKPSKKEFKIQALVDSAGSFASGAETLDTATLRLRKMVNEINESEKIDTDRIDAMLIELENSFEQFKKAEKKFWDELE